MRRKMKILAMILILLSTCLVVCFKLQISQNTALVSGTKDKEFCLIIDAGHGGFDGGAVSKDGTIEKDINLQIALQLEDVLKDYPVNVIMTRTEDTSLEEGYGKVKKRKQQDLMMREQIIEEAGGDLTISIHLNSYPGDESVYGAQVFYPQKEQKRTDVERCEQLSKMYGESVQKSLETNISDGRERMAMAKNDTYLLKNIDTPIILVECGFLSNNDECQRLKTLEYQRLLAESIWDGINNVLGLEKEQKIQIIQSANKVK